MQHADETAVAATGVLQHVCCFKALSKCDISSHDLDAAPDKNMAVSSQPALLAREQPVKANRVNVGGHEESFRTTL